ncbi:MULTISPECIES: NADP-dependent oxidoreductase [unclassified Nocardioides]|uniref:NADP-dependent oxidoreductase n=1 Tax=unclassified Nocardioides TaxID=2615069 RepID=UPI00191119DD|nr:MULTISPECIES: NADP-dependent oxidoreductase [unclassified Nocardioides]
MIELPDPEPRVGEIRVRVYAAAVSPTDTLRRAGVRALDGQPATELADQDFPLVPGMEFAGVVVEIGPDTDADVKVGDHVMGAMVPSGTRGSYAEQVVVPADSVVRTPAGVDDVAASTLPMNGLTALISIDALQVAPGQTIGVTGAAGTYGGYVVQLAKAAGLRVIADAAEKDRDLVASFGADVVVARGDDVADRFLEAAPGGLDGLVDGAVLNELVVGAVRPGGRLVTVRHYESEPIGGVTFHAVRVRYFVHDRAKLEQLRELVDSGQLTLRVAQTFPAADASEAHEVLARGGTRGRLVLTFDD